MIKQEDIEKLIKKHNYKLLGQIKVNKEAHEELCEYLKDKLTNKDRYVRTILEPDLKLSLALVQIAIYYYREGKYRPYLEKKLGVKVSTNKLNEIYQIFMKTLEEYNLFMIKKEENEANKYVENIKAQAFSTNYYMEGLFEFTYDFWENNLFRTLSEDINEDLEELSTFMKTTLQNNKDMIECNTKIAKSYRLLKSTRIVISQIDLQDLKTMFYPILEMIDINYYDNKLPIEKKDRFSQLFIKWCQKKEEKIEGKIRRENKERRIYSYKPFIHYDMDKMFATLIIPKQKFRGIDCDGTAKVQIIINGKCMTYDLELYMYSGVYISEEKMILIPDIFDKIEISIQSISEKKYIIENKDYRIFDSNWDSIPKLNIGYNHIILKSGITFSSTDNESIIDSYEDSKIQYFYVKVGSKTIYYADNKPLSILGEFSFEPLFENIIDKFEIYDSSHNKLLAAKEHPVVSFLVDKNKLDGSVLIINNNKYPISKIEDKKVYEWEENKNKKAISIDLKEILSTKEDFYNIEIDIPGEPNKTLTKYMLLTKFNCYFNKKRYTYDEKAILTVVKSDLNVSLISSEAQVSFETNENIQYIIDISSKLTEIELQLKNEIDTYIIKIPLKVFLYGFSKEHMNFERLDYIWYTDVENILYIKMPGAIKIMAYLGRDKETYSEGVEIEPELFKIDISSIKEIINKDDKKKIQYINIEYEDSEIRRISLPMILRNMYIKPYFQLNHENGKVFIETEIKGKAEVYLTVKDAKTQQIIIEDKIITNGKTYLPELSIEGLYDIHPSMCESDEFGFSRKITPLKFLRDIGCVDLNNLVDCKLPIKKIYMEEQELQTEEYYSIKVIKKANENEYIGNIVSSQIENGKYIPNTFKFLGRVKFTIFEDEDMKVCMQIYSKLEECWIDLYYDKKQKIIISGDSKLLDSTKDYDRFLTLEDAEFVINVEKIRRNR